MNRYLQESALWLQTLPELSLASLRPAETAIVAVDVLNGFATAGSLASERVAATVRPVASLLALALASGVPAAQVVLMADRHPSDAEEFAAFPPHCVLGGHEAQWAAEVEAAVLGHDVRCFCKNSVASHHVPELEAWLQETAPRNLIAVGSVTDLCLYALAMHLVTRSQQFGLGQRVIVPADGVATFDMPDHPAELHHLVFLRQLARLGVEVVSGVR